MSKIGKKNISIPKESSIKIEGANLTISGPKGTKKFVNIDNCKMKANFVGAVNTHPIRGELISYLSEENFWSKKA